MLILTLCQYVTDTIGENMKITVLTGSSRKNGTSNYMADEFIRGAKESGHEIYRFDSAHSDVKNCISCNACAMGSKPCIHKDDFEFYLGDSNLKLYGSQGQMRISVLTLKLSEIEIFKKWKNSTPILLLDDVFSEIDEIKNNNLLNYLSRDLQVIITAVSLNSFNKEILSKAKVFRIESGKIKLDRLNREVKDDRRTL